MDIIDVMVVVKVKVKAKSGCLCRCLWPFSHLQPFLIVSLAKPLPLAFKATLCCVMIINTTTITKVIMSTIIIILITNMAVMIKAHKNK